MKVSGISLLAGVVFGCAALAAAAPAHADVILQTASFSGNDPGDYPVLGDGTNGNSRFIGARFSVSGQTEITSVDIGLGEFGSGTIFAAIVPLSGTNAVPSVDPASLASIALGSVLLTVPNGTSDVSGALSVDLAAGDYAVVFGSGLFGASGVGPVSDGNTPIGNSSLFTSLFGPDWFALDDSGIRVEVDGTPIPEPSSLSLLAVGGLLATVAIRRKRRVG